MATQLGNHGRSSEGHRQTAEWIWDGAIGQVREVHAWASAGWFAMGHGRPEDTPPVPPGLNWDLWLGPAEERPYHPAYAPFNWRGWWDFGGSGLPDVAVHHLDPAFNALELDTPETVEATAAWNDEEVAASGVLATWRFGPRRNMDPVTVYWYDSGLRPPTPLGVDPDDPRQRMGEGREGIIFIGDKGIITAGGWSGMPRLLPRELHRSYERPEKTIPRVKGHHADWLQACKGGTPGLQQLRVRRASVRVRPARGGGGARPAAAAVVRPDHDDHQRARGEPVPEGPLPDGLGAPRLKLAGASRLRRTSAHRRE